MLPWPPSQSTCMCPLADISWLGAEHFGENFLQAIQQDEIIDQMVGQLSTVVQGKWTNKIKNKIEIILTPCCQRKCVWNKPGSGSTLYLLKTFSSLNGPKPSHMLKMLGGTFDFFASFVEIVMKFVHIYYGVYMSDYIYMYMYTIMQNCVPYIHSFPWCVLGFNAQSVPKKAVNSILIQWEKVKASMKFSLAIIFSVNYVYMTVYSIYS